jgi:hypothetical protein
MSQIYCFQSNTILIEFIHIIYILTQICFRSGRKTDDRNIGDKNIISINNLKYPVPNSGIWNFFHLQADQSLTEYSTSRNIIKLNLQNPIVIQMIRIILRADIAFNYTSIIDVGTYKRCNFIANKIKNETVWKNIYTVSTSHPWIICESDTSENFYKPSTYISFDISSETSISLKDIGIYLVEPYGIGQSIENPLCGKPDIPYGVNDYIIDDQTTHAMNCRDNFLQFRDTKNQNHTISCDFNSKWDKTKPECVPKISCPKFKSGINSLLNVSSYEYAYYQNNKTWYLIEGSKANLSCQNNKNIAATCREDGQWDKDCTGRGKKISHVLSIFLFKI